MLGKPKYRYNDIVRFHTWNDDTEYEGRIVVVDSYGTIGQDQEPSYDILVPGIALFKHNPESWITGQVRGSDNS